MPRRSSSCSMPQLQASGAGLRPPCTAPQMTCTVLAAAEGTQQPVCDFCSPDCRWPELTSNAVGPRLHCNSTGQQKICHSQSGQPVLAAQA